MATNNAVAGIKEKTQGDMESTQSKRRAKITNKQRYFDAKDARKYYDINVYKAYQSRKFRTMGKKYTVQFKDMSKDITLTEYPKVLPNIMNTLVDDLKNENNIKDADYVRSVVHHPSLKSEMWIPFSQSTDMSGDAILQEVQKVQQSNEDFKMEDGHTTIDWLHVEIPMGSGGNSKKHLHTDQENFRKGKKSIVRIEKILVLGEWASIKFIPCWCVLANWICRRGGRTLPGVGEWPHSGVHPRPSRKRGKGVVASGSCRMFHKGGDGKPRGFGFSGFALKKESEPPPSGLSGMPGSGGGAGSKFMPGRSFGYHTNIGKKRARNEDEYFDDEDEDDMAYQPAPGSPGAKKNDDSDSDDPLDAFMAGIEKEVSDLPEDEKKKKEKEKKPEKGVRDDIDNEDDQESFFRYMEENPMAGVVLDDDDIEIEYDAEGNPIIPEKNKIIDPLPPIDHDDVDYCKFEKNFYVEHEEIITLEPKKVDDLRQKLGIRVSGFAPPKPVSSFGHFGFDENLISAIRKSEFTQPTPIQAQGIPIALSGRDIIGIAKTGSGKTAAFLWPLLVHIMDQKELEPGDGPIGLILAPTRELSQQIYHEAKKFGKVYNINVVCAYGGGSMWEQTKACQEGAEIIVATPGRLIDLVKKKATNLTRVTYLVFDEADRMFDMGFEPQVRSIANHVRPDRQTMLFSATFRKRVEKLARDILIDPIRVVQGEAGEANEDITQIVEVLPVGPAKWTWLIKRLVEFTTMGSVLIFVTRKANSEELATNLKARDFDVGLLHGDMTQMERNEVISSFKKKEMPILVATDVAARGLDIPSIKTVVNYDVARDIDTHTHRIGRTGRAGEKGFAYTLITDKDKEFAGSLVRNLEVASQHVPHALLEIAEKNPWFKKSRVKQGKGKKMNVGGKGLGFKERPGLGSESSTRVQDSTSLGSFRGVGSSAGPQADRLSAMKAAFSAQFKSNFVQASMDGVPARIGGGLEEPSKRKKKSRWE
ncbi:hypothetical protein FSP39_019665 [Pinctada imbricata]|uniref:ATP-dependent RNA helicase DDX42 n=1 Tax=Pinctada imbricata TaxID=66713 RepID=A0AA89C4T3_PINIB|nr:hypothetical protein FSP39_019665 [Pinctada imbricata]